MITIASTASYAYTYIHTLYIRTSHIVRSLPDQQSTSCAARNRRTLSGARLGFGVSVSVGVEVSVRVRVRVSVEVSGTVRVCVAVMETIITRPFHNT